MQSGWTYEPPTFYETNSADGPESATRVTGIAPAVAVSGRQRRGPGGGMLPGVERIAARERPTASVQRHELGIADFTAVDAAVLGDQAAEVRPQKAVERLGRARARASGPRVPAAWASYCFCDEPWA